MLLTIDGSYGEGGGQILRTSLALSLVTGKPCRIVNIRVGRKKPGLMRQHLAAVRAAAEIGRATIEGAELGSKDLTFAPQHVVPGEYHFAVGSAGSATLVVETILPALITARGPSRLVVEGGTHNPYAPPFDFLARSFLPLLNQMGPNVSMHLDRAGFFPAGGGQLTVSIEPHPNLRATDLLERGPISRRRATAVVAKLPRHIAERELAVIQRELGWTMNELTVKEVKSAGPGNVVMLELAGEHVTEVATSFGMRGVRAETVANRVVQQLQRYLAADVPVGEHLADQLLVLLAVANGGSFRTLQPSRHTATNIQVLRQFLGINIATRQLGEDAWLVEVKR